MTNRPHVVIATLTGEEVSLLKACLDTWEAGLPEAEEATIEDPTIDDLETFTELVDGYRQQREALQGIRFKLRLVEGR